MNEETKQEINRLFGDVNIHEQSEEDKQLWAELDQREELRQQQIEENIRLGKTRQQVALDDYGEWIASLDINPDTWQTNEHEILMQNKAYRTKQFNKAMHDYVYLDSMEHHLLDMADGIGNKDKDVIMTKSEARQYAKEKGVEWNSKDKETISKFQLDKQINRELLKRNLEQEIAEYSQYKDYTKWDGIQRAGNAISGAVGLGEVAATIGLGYFTAWGIGAAITNIGANTLKAVKITKAVNTLQKMQTAQKAINYQQTILKELQLANKTIQAEKLAKAITKSKTVIPAIQKEIETADLGTKIAYDMARFGKHSLPGARASHLSVAVPFTIDSALSDIPREGVQATYSQMFNTGEYGSKEIIRDLTMASALGFMLPFSGEVIKVGGKTVGYTLGKGTGAIGNMCTSIINKSLAKNNEKIYEEVLRGLKSKDAITKNKAIVQSYLDIENSIKANSVLSPEQLQIAKAIDDMNLTEEEFHSIITQNLTVMATGENVPFVPPRTQWMSTVPKLYDIAKNAEKQGQNIDEIWNTIKQSGIAIKTESQWTKGKVDVDYNFLDEFKYKIKKVIFDSTAKFKDETGYLGNTSIRAINNMDSEYLLKNLYIAHLLPDTQVGKLAKQAIEEYTQNLKRISDQIKLTVERYNEVIQINKDKDYISAKKLWAEVKGEEDTRPYEWINEGAYSPIGRNFQLVVYPQLNGTYGRLESAIHDILFELLPKQIKDEYSKNLELTKILGVQKSLTEKESVQLKEARKNLREINDTIFRTNSEMDSLLFKETEKTYHNPNGDYTTTFTDLIPFTDKNTKGARIEFIGKQIDEIIANNEKLLNAEETYQKLLPDADELLQPQEIKETINTSAAEYEARRRSDFSIVKFIQSNNAKLDRYNTSRVNLEKVMADENISNMFNTVLAHLQKGVSSKTKVAEAFLSRFMNKTNLIDEIFKDDLNIVRNQIIENCKTSPLFSEILAKPNLGKITDKSVIWKIPKYRNEFKDIIKRSFNETLNSSGKYTEIFGDKLDQILDDSMDAFDNYLKKNMDSGMKDLATPHAYNAEVNSKEEIAQELVARTQQELAFNEILSPFFEQIIYSAMDMQANNYEEMARLMNFMKLCDIYPGQLDELALSQITMSPNIFEGSSISTEALSQINSEWTQFMSGLVKNDNAAIRDNIIPQAIVTDKSFIPLRDYAMDPDNMPVIKEAIYDRLRFINGEMTEEEAKLYNRQSNTRAARVAQEYLNTAAQLKQILFNAGSNKNRIVNLLDNTKIKNPTTYLRLNKMTGNYANAIKSIDAIANPIQEALLPLKRFVTPLSNDREGLADCNMALDFFEKLDLDKQFRNRKNYSYNEFRDALTSEEGIEGYVNNQLRERIKNFKITNAEIITEEREKILKDLNKISKELNQHFFGIPGEDIGFINRIKGDINHVQDPLTTSFKARYVEDIEPKFSYKNTEYERQDLKTFGYDNMKSMFENNIGSAKKAYAVLSKLGEEPMQHMLMMKEIIKGYAEKIAPQRIGFKQAKEIIDRKLTPIWERSLEYNLHNVCGTYTVPANMFQKWTQIILRTLTSPMLMNAGFRSLTDYNYQTQMMITTGLASEGDLQARARVTQSIIRAFTKDKELAKRIFISETVRNETLYSMMYNSSLGSGDIIRDTASGPKRFWKSIKAAGKVVTDPYMSGFEKAEILSKRYTDTVLNKWAFIGPMTNYNRENAAINTMLAIGEFSSTKYAQMPKRLQQTLTRFGITEYEWDNILSKHIVTNSEDYISQLTESGLKNELLDSKMFFPELVDKISEDDLIKMMTDQKLHISDVSKAKYRQYLKDKASLLINSSADEMTSIPCSRIQGLMSAHALPNTGLNFFLNTVLQFQSFGAAINYYQWGRRLASLQTQDDTFKHLLSVFAGHPADSLTMAQFIAESALVEFFVGEGLREIKGTNRRLVNDRKEFQGEALSEKVTDAVGATLGLGNMLTQTIMSKFTQATGQGGGLSIPALPAVSTLLQKVERPIAAATKKSTEGNRGKAIAGAIGQDIADVAALPNNVFVYPLWGLLIGDTWREWQAGDRKEAIKTQRLHRGYTPSWTRHIAEETGIIRPNETTLYSQFTGDR